MSSPTAEPIPTQSHAILESGRYRRRVLTAIALTAITVILLLLAWTALDVLLLIFLSALFAVALRGMSNWISRRTRLNDKLSVGIVLLLIVVAFILLIVLLGRQIAGQLDQLTEQIPASIESVRAWLVQYDWGETLLSQIPTGEELNESIFGSVGSSLSRFGGIFSSTLGGLANTIIVIALTAYFALEPEVYINNLIRLVPPTHRPRALDILAQTGAILRKWLQARFLSMLFVGTLTTIGLALLGAPLALSLGLIAGLLSFIPTFGPIISVIPAALLAFLVSPEQALYVILLYIIVQQIDNYLITPLIERATVSLPPALTIIAQLFLGILTGFLGLVLAAPLAVVLIVLVRTLYVEDVLHDRTVTT